jgi:hypothetical protein
MQPIMGIQKAILGNMVQCNPPIYIEQSQASNFFANIVGPLVPA